MKSFLPLILCCLLTAACSPPPSESERMLALDNKPIWPGDCFRELGATRIVKVTVVNHVNVEYYELNFEAMTKTMAGRATMAREFVRVQCPLP